MKPWAHVAWSRCRAVLRQRRLDREFDEELSTHLELLVDEGRRNGLSPADARKEALRKLGRPQSLRETNRDDRGLPVLDVLAQDLRYTLRILWKTRTTRLVAFVTLALAIGATTAIFTVVDALLLRSLPFPDANRLVQVGRAYPSGLEEATSVPKFMHWRTHGRQVFLDMAAYGDLGSGFNLARSDRPERLIGSRVSAAFFDVMGVQPLLGRAFRQEEDLPGGPRLVILGYTVWKNHFEGRPDIIGQAISLNSEPYRVVGVMPGGFRFPDAADLWTLFQFDPGSQSRANNFKVIARLKPETTLNEARASMDVAGHALRRALPDLMGANETIGLRPVRDQLYGDMRSALLILLAAVGFVLLIACVNVANLQLAQAAERHHELALRAALGASRWTVVRQLLLESVLLASGSGVAGVALAYAGVPALLALSPVHVAYADAITVDWRVLGFALVISVVAGLAVGLLPAWQSARPNLDAVLRSGGHRMIGKTSGWTRRTLVASEVALALILTIGACLLVKSFAGLQSRHPGFAVENVLTMKLALPEARYGTGEALARFQERLEERLATIPGVRAAALAHTLPLELGSDLPFTIEGRYVPGTEQGVENADYRPVSRSYFKALDIPVRRGRLFDARDRRGALPVAIINESAARRIWPREDPIGQRITVGQPFVPDLADTSPREIIGIVADVREEGLGTNPPSIVYVPLSQQNDRYAAVGARLLPYAVVVRGETRVEPLTRSLQQAIWSIDPQQAISDVRPMREIVAESLGSDSFNAVLLGGLASLALLLAAVGLYGVIAHLVGQQTREIGVRMALGATRAGVLALFLRQALTTVTVGIVVGLVGAFGVTRALRTLLTGISTTDPWVFGLAPLLMLGVALVAAGRPAIRAARVDPAQALRAE